jgi:hypothetical protein
MKVDHWMKLGLFLGVAGIIFVSPGFGVSKCKAETNLPDRNIPS